MGDPSGIGPEIILKALSFPGIQALADFTVIGDGGVLERVALVTGNRFQVTGSRLQAAGYMPLASGFKLVDLENVPKKGFMFGKVSPVYGKAALEYLDKALEMIRKKEADCVVTAPMNKEAVSLTGCKFPGHTEYIAKACNVKDVVMMLLNKKLRVSLATGHIPLKDVPKKLNKEMLYKAIEGTISGLKLFFNISSPRLAVCGLNPHASDNGVLGDEERHIIFPVVNGFRRKGAHVQGPYPSDTIFSKVSSYDCVVCMYHDQGLIPLKLTGFNDAVNITLGLPFVRTSPGHGTAFDIAGKNKANPHLLMNAIKTAAQCSKNLKNLI